MVIAPSEKMDRTKRHHGHEPAFPRPAEVSPGEVPAPPAEEKVHVVGHPIAQHALTLLRNKLTPTKPFRSFSSQLLAVLAIEATRSLPIRDELVETPAESHVGRTLGKPVIFLSLTRHGLGLAHNVADFIPEASIGAISLDQGENGHRIAPRLHLANAPALSDAMVILFDPVVGTGFSASIALQRLRSCGASDISLLSFLITAPGLQRVQETVPDLKVWVAAIERDFDPKKGPLPGLGNFAERLYGLST